MERRQESHLSFEPDQGVLVVGARTAVLDAAPPAEVVVCTYVELVLAQRAVTPASRSELRDRELEQLAALLDLPAGDLDSLIDRELERLLAPEAVGAAPVPGGRARRRTLAFGAIAIVAVAAAIAAATTAGGADPASDPAPVVQPDGSTVETITLPDGSTATRTESAPAPQTEDGVDIGTAVQIER